MQYPDVDCYPVRNHPVFEPFEFLDMPHVWVSFFWSIIIGIYWDIFDCVREGMSQSHFGNNRTLCVRASASKIGVLAQTMTFICKL